MLSCLAVLRAVCCCCQTGWSVWFNYKYIPNLTYNSSIVGFVLIFLLFPFFSFPLPSLYLPRYLSRLVFCSGVPPSFPLPFPGSRMKGGKGYPNIDDFSQVTLPRLLQGYQHLPGLMIVCIGFGANTSI